MLGTRKLSMFSNKKLNSKIPQLNVTMMLPLTEVKDPAIKNQLERHQYFLSEAVKHFQSAGQKITFTPFPVGDMKSQLAKMDSTPTIELFKKNRLKDVLNSNLQFLLLPANTPSTSRGIEFGANKVTRLMARQFYELYAEKLSAKDIEKYFKSLDLIYPNIIGPSKMCVMGIDEMPKTTLLKGPNKKVNGHYALFTNKDPSEIKKEVGYPNLDIVKLDGRDIEMYFAKVIHEFYVNKWVPHFAPGQSVEQELTNLERLEHELGVDARRCSKR